MTMDVREAARLWQAGESKLGIRRECQADMRLYTDLKDYLTDDEYSELTAALTEQGQDLNDLGKL